MDYFTKVLSSPASNANNQLVELLGTVHNEIVKLEYVYFPLKLVKRQKREKKISMQRIENGNVSFMLDFASIKYKQEVNGVSVGVKRTNESNNGDRSVGCIPIKQIDVAHVQDTKILVKVDLDSVHIYKDKKVYELDRAREELNLFHLIVDIQFLNGEIVTQNTRPFKLIGRKCTGTVGGKRPSIDSRNTKTSMDSGLETSVIQAVPNIGEVDSGESGYESPLSLTSQFPSTHETQDLIEACTVVAEHIKTKYLDLDGESIINLNSIQAIKTPNGDIAYHFLLENDDDVFEEGEVVGFVPNEKFGSKQVITKLTSKTASRAILKGVITRSQFLEAQKPSKSVCSETIAMLGIVPVQVHGSVYANEAIYASTDHPGFAVSARHLDVNMINEAAFIGYAFSSRQADNNNSMGVVQVGVSVLQSAGLWLLQNNLRKVEERYNKEIKAIKKKENRTGKCLCCAGTITGLLFTLIAIFIWQLMFKGSAYRYFRCKQGRKDPEGEAYFHFIPSVNQDIYPRVNGIEFTFEELMKKSHHYDYKQLNGTGYRYYLNIDRCAYGGQTNADLVSGGKRVRGPDIFAVDYKCFCAYYYIEHLHTWVKYNSVSWEKRKNIYCMPQSRWKRKLTKNQIDIT